MPLDDTSFAKLIAGVDEAGRGPYIGPLVVAGVATENPEVLRALGVRDSKKLSPKQRAILEPRIRQVARVFVRIVGVDELNVRLPHESMNSITRTAFQDVLHALRPHLAQLDLCGNQPDRWCSQVADGLKVSVDLVSRPRADAYFPTVSAASIVAKEERERQVRMIQAEHGDCGGGYPRDKKWLAYVADWKVRHGGMPPFVRLTWGQKRPRKGSERIG